MKKALFCILLLAGFSQLVLAQQKDIDFEIRNYDIRTAVISENLNLDIHAKLRLLNLNGKELANSILVQPEKPRMTFFLHQKATLKAMSVNGTGVKFNATADRYLPLLRVTTEITSSVAAAQEFDVEFDYSIPSSDRNTTMHLSESEGFALPTSFWFPIVHTPYADHGADTAPMRLSITTPKGVIAGPGNKSGDGSFEQPLAAQPYFFYGDFEVTNVTGPKGAKIEIYSPRGVAETGKQQIQKLADETSRIIGFYSDYFDMPQMGPFRIVLTNARNINYSDNGIVSVESSFLRRDTLDLGTVELVAGAAAKSFIDGRVLLRGRATGFFRDGLPVFLAAQYLGQRFGDAQRTAAFERYRRSYEPIARGTDIPLLQLSPYDRTYTTVMYNKGGLIWRLFEQKLGKTNFDGFIKSLFDRRRVDVVTAVEWKGKPLCRLARCLNLKSEIMLAAGSNSAVMKDLVSQWIETLIVPDLAVGQPQDTPAGVEATVTNFGSGEVMADVIAVTQSGETINKQVLVKGGEFGSVTYPAGTKIAKIEVDPLKLFPQKDYSNDVFPRKAAVNELYGQASLAYGKKDYATAEAKLREAISLGGNVPSWLALLGRVLVAAGKTQEASQAFATALKAEPFTIQAYGWSNLGLGEIALQAGRNAEAIKYLSLAAAADLDPASVFTAHDGIAKAQKATGQFRIPEDVKSFCKQMDDAMLAGTSEAVAPFVERGNLREFVKKVTGNKPSVWTTDILSAEVIDANHVIVDANLKVKILLKEGSGRVIYILTRAEGKLKLSEVPVFEVR